MKKLMLLLILIFSMGGMMAQLQYQIKPVGAWASIMGCTKACSDYLGYEYSLDWISGVTGFAFLMNMHPVVCPSGPTAFDNGFLKRNAKALGLDFEVIDFSKGEGDLAAKQREAFVKVKQALVENHPVFGWELGIPEYYLIAGTDENAYQYFDFDGSIKHCPWDSIATSEIGMAEFCILKREKPLEPVEQAKAAFKFLDRYAADPASYALEGYTMGNPAYDMWIKALSDGKADPWGLGYNSRVWAEARSHALGFIGQLKTLLEDEAEISLLDSAASDFKIVADDLAQLCKLYSFPPQEQDQTPEKTAKAIELLTQAKAAEAAGVEALLEFARKM